MPKSKPDLKLIIQAIQQSETPFLSPIGPAIIATAAFNIHTDSRSFARAFKLAHALVIRECMHLSEELKLIEIYKHNEKNQSIHYQISQKGKDILAPEH